MSKLISGKQLSIEMLEELKNKVSLLNSHPKLVVVLVGDNKASEIYIRKKCEACKEIGIEFNLIKKTNDISQSELIELIELIKLLNDDVSVNGYIIQLPLPKHLNIDKLINYIDPKKDVDCFHPSNIGLLTTTNNPQYFIPPTPGGCY